MIGLLNPLPIVGWIPFTCILNEVLIGETRVSSYSVQNGMNVSDTYYVLPEKLHLKAEISPLNSSFIFGPVNREVKFLYAQAYPMMLRLLRNNPKSLFFILTHTNIYFNYVLLNFEINFKQGDKEEVGLSVDFEFMHINKIRKNIINRNIELKNGGKLLSEIQIKKTQINYLNKLKEAAGI